MTTKKTQLTKCAATDDLVELPYLLECKTQFVPKILCLIVRGIKFKYEAPNQTGLLYTGPHRAKPDYTKLDRTILDHTEPNQGLYCQIIRWRQKTENSTTEVNPLTPN